MASALPRRSQRERKKCSVDEQLKLGAPVMQKIGRVKHWGEISGLILPKMRTTDSALLYKVKFEDGELGEFNQDRDNALDNPKKASARSQCAIKSKTAASRQNTRSQVSPPIHTSTCSSQPGRIVVIVCPHDDSIHTELPYLFSRGQEMTPTPIVVRCLVTTTTMSARVFVNLVVIRKTTELSRKR